MRARACKYTVCRRASWLINCDVLPTTGFFFPHPVTPIPFPFPGDGRVFHIDFGRILGDWQRFLGISRDRAPLVIGKDFVHVVGKGPAALLLLLAAAAAAATLVFGAPLLHHSRYFPLPLD